MNKLNTNGKAEGYWEEYYSHNGWLVSEGNYINGLRDGYWQFYHHNGKTWRRGHYVNDLREGYWEHFKGNEISYKGCYQNGKREGEWKWYDRDILWQKGNCINGLKEGCWETYYRDGKLCCNTNYVNNEPSGYSETFNEKGKKRIEKNFFV